MYPEIKNKDGSLKHSHQCKMAFGRKDPECPRCAELLSGEPAKDGWQKRFFELKGHNDEMEKLAREAHFAPNGPHASGKCGPVCTFGDY